LRAGAVEKEVAVEFRHRDISWLGGQDGLCRDVAQVPPPLYDE
jgi:hypothetical protein